MEVTYKPEEIKKVISNLSYISEMRTSADKETAIIIDRPIRELDQIIEYRIGILGMFSSSHRVADRIKNSLQKEKPSGKYPYG